MIPKIIHYCWFGGKKICDEHLSYIDNWKRILNGYEFRLWNEQNSPMHIPYLKTAYQQEKWANVSDYVRLHAVFLEGGIYLDTDVSLVASLDPFLTDNCFFGFQKHEVWASDPVNNAVMGAVPGHWFIRNLKEEILLTLNGTELPTYSGPKVLSSLLKREGLNSYGEQMIRDIHLYPIHYFYPSSPCGPKSSHDQDERGKTVAIHQWAGYWLERNQTKGYLHKARRRIVMVIKPILKRLLLTGSFVRILRSIWSSPKFLRLITLHIKQSLSEKLVVHDGPFQGMKYPSASSCGSELYPKLIGCYESQLHRVFWRGLDENYTRVINIGAAEGYYAVGLARLYPHVRVLACDVQEKAISLLLEMAKLNGVADRIQAICEKYSAARLKRDLNAERVFILCDCEGDEGEIFSEEVVPLLQNADLMIELHSFIDLNIEEMLLKRFSSTHKIEIINEQKPNFSLYRAIQDCPLKSVLSLIDERRMYPTKWAFMSSREKGELKAA